MCSPVILCGELRKVVSCKGHTMNGEAGTRKQINSLSAVTCATDLGPSMRGQTSILRRFLLLEIMKEPGPQSPLWGSTGVSGGQTGESTL